jgi:hypothetical protein
VKEGRVPDEAVRHGPLLERHPHGLAIAGDRGHEHGDPSGLDPLAGDQALDVGRHRLGLGALVRASPEHHLAPRSRRRPLRPAPQRGERSLEHELRTADAPLERDHPSAGAEVLEPRCPRPPEPAHGRVRVARRRQARAGDGAHEARGRQVELLGVVDEDVLEARAYLRTLAREPERLADELARVTRSGLAEHPVVGAVDLGELALERRPLAPALALAKRGGPGHVLLGVDELGLEPVDAAHEAAKERARVAAEVVAAQGELVDAFEQHGQAIGGADDHREGIEAGVVEQAGGELPGGSDDELLVSSIEPVNKACAHRVSARRGRGEDENPLRRHALLREPGEARFEHSRLPAPGRAAHEQRTAPVRDCFDLSREQSVALHAHSDSIGW